VTPPSDHLSLDVERALIENAVRAIPALHMVKTQARTIQTTSGQKLDSDSYFTLLIYAAITPSIIVLHLECFNMSEIILILNAHMQSIHVPVTA
jgi:hypothetical protein